jgi:hypothetical protein
LRNAVAHFDDDFAIDGPPRKSKAPRKSRAAATKRKSASRGKKGRPRYLNYAAVGLSASLVVGIMINALALQHSRHPAPLFGKAIPLGASASVAAVTPPAVPATPKPAEQVRAEPDPAPAPLTMPAPVQRPHHAAADNATSPSKPKPDDAIAKLLKVSTMSATSDRTPTKIQEKENPKTIMAAQHALMKLGFVVKPNGTFGPATKAALESFERDQHLPVKGEMSRKILKQLSTESGVAID